MVILAWNQVRFEVISALIVAWARAVCFSEAQGPGVTAGYVNRPVGNLPGRQLNVSIAVATGDNHHQLSRTIRRNFWSATSRLDSAGRFFPTLVARFSKLCCFFMLISTVD